MAKTRRRGRRHRLVSDRAMCRPDDLQPDMFGSRRAALDSAPEPSGPNGFYVYQLVDPRTSLPFYVGKGQRDRAWQHEKQFRAGKLTSNPRKCAVIAEIVALGLSVEVKIVRRFESEVDALDLEYLMVEENPTLTNIQVGGAGLSPAALERRARRRRELYLAKRAGLLEQQVENKRKKLLAVRGAARYTEEINGWVDSLKDKGALLRLGVLNRSGRVSKTDLAKFRASRPT